MTSEPRKVNQTIPMICKVVELCLTIVIVGLIVDPTNNGILAFDQNHSGIVYVAWPGYIIINTIIIISYLIGDRIPKRTNILFSLVGACIFIAASGVSLSDWVQHHQGTTFYKLVQQYNDQAIAAGIMSLLTALAFLMMFSFVGAILYIAAASVVISDWRKNQTDPTLRPSKQYQDMTISAAVLAIFTSLLMFCETAALAVFDDEEEDE